VRLVLIALLVAASWASVAQASTGTPAHPAKQTWQQAKHNVGGYSCVTSRAVGAKHVNWKSGDGSMTFIDFGWAYPSKAGLTVVVWNLDASRLKGRIITVCGPVTLYKGSAELSTDRMPS
jgi:hypothetical protein